MGTHNLQMGPRNPKQEPLLIPASVLGGFFFNSKIKQDVIKCWYKMIYAKYTKVDKWLMDTDALSPKQQKHKRAKIDNLHSTQV